MIRDHRLTPLYERSIVRQRGTTHEFMITAIQHVPHHARTICSILRLHSMTDTKTLLLVYVMDSEQTWSLLDVVGNEWEAL